MSNPYIGEIRMFAGNFAPSGWAFCDGSLLSIANYEALYQLIGTTYGGDGVNTFALPDLRSRVPLHQGTGPGSSTYVLGQNGGGETVTLTATQLPAHVHTAQGSSDVGTTNSPGAGVWAAQPLVEQFQPTPTPGESMNPASIAASTGGGQPHDNMLPYLGINFIISLFGVFPSQN